MAIIPTPQRSNTRPPPTPKADALRRIIASYRSKILRIYPSAVFASEQTLGCSEEELATYIESKFRDGMNWENYGANKVWSFSSLNKWSSLDLGNPDVFYAAVRFSSFVPVLNSEMGGSLRNLMGVKKVAPEKPILGEIKAKFSRGKAPTHYEEAGTDFKQEFEEET